MSCGCGVTIPAVPVPETKTVKKVVRPDPVVEPLPPLPGVGSRPDWFVTYVLEDGTIIETVRVRHGDNLELPEPPTIPGYVFAGWSGSVTNISAHGLVVARYILEVIEEPTPIWNVTFKDSGGGIIEQKQVLDGCSCSPPLPPTSGCLFGGWVGRFDNVRKNEVVQAICMDATYQPPAIADIPCPPPEPPGWIDDVVDPEPTPQPDPDPGDDDEDIHVPKPMRLRFDLSKGTRGNILVLPIHGFVGEIRWGDGAASLYTSEADVIGHQYPVAGVYEVTLQGSASHWGKVEFIDRRILTDIIEWGDDMIVSDFGDIGDGNNNSGMLAERFDFTISATDYPFFRSGSARGMFRGCGTFNSDISHWDLHNVNDCESMFDGCSLFNQDISNWDVSNVVNFKRMFAGTKTLDADLSHWPVVSGRDMSFMFLNSAVSFNPVLWSVMSADNMDYMFYGASNMNHDLSTWCVLGVTTAPNRFVSPNWTGVMPIWGNCG